MKGVHAAVAVLVAVVCVCALGVSSARPRVLSGTAAAPGEYPYQVGFTDGSEFIYCGGTILSPLWILTAAHCVAPEADTPEIVFVLPGTVNRTEIAASSGSILSAVAEIIVHPLYINMTVRSYDIALVRLAQPLDLSGSSLMDAVVLADSEPPVGAVITIIGWGANTVNATGEPVLLQHVDTLVASNADCAANYALLRPDVEIIPSQLCAGQYCVERVDSCNGDSGGPLMVPAQGGGLVQAALTSWGGIPPIQWCGHDTLWAVNTRVAHYLPWIESHVGAGNYTTGTPASGSTTTAGGGHAACPSPPPSPPPPPAVVVSGALSGSFSDPLVGVSGSASASDAAPASFSGALVLQSGATLSVSRSSASPSPSPSPTPPPAAVSVVGTLSLSPSSTLAVTGSGAVAVGSLSFDASGVLLITLNAELDASAEGAITVSGPVTLGGAFRGAIDPAQVVVGTSYVLLKASGGASGSFTSVTLVALASSRRRSLKALSDANPAVATNPDGSVTLTLEDPSSTTSSPPPSPLASPPSSGLSTGATVGIILAVIIIMVLVAAAMALFILKSRGSAPKSSDPAPSKTDEIVLADDLAKV